MTTAVCAHHWVCESPNGPTSLATCKHCKTTREFKNYDAPIASYNARPTAPAISQRKSEQETYVLSTAYVPAAQKAPRQGRVLPDTSRTQRILDFVALNEGCLTKEVAEAVGLTVKNVAARMVVLVQEDRLDRRPKFEGSKHWRYYACGEAGSMTPPGASDDGYAVLIPQGRGGSCLSKG